MKKNSKIHIIICVSLCILTMAFIGTIVIGCSTCKTGPDIFEEGFFKYFLRSSDENSAYVVIDGLTDNGIDQKELTLPAMINDCPVKKIGEARMWGYRGNWESENLLKLFVPFEVEIEINFNDCPNLRKVIVLPQDLSLEIGRNQYVSSVDADKIQDGSNILNAHQLCCNLSFMYNYKNAPNANYYWIDDVDYGNYIEQQPKNPTREGHTFQGWYKEATCENLWEFDKDRLPEIEYTVENKISYQETRLYAKWL